MRIFILLVFISFYITPILSFNPEHTPQVYRVLSHEKAARKDLSAFENLDLSEASFEGMDLSYLEFKNCNFKAAQFKGANLYKTRFEKCTITCADFSSDKPAEGTDVATTKLDATFFMRCNISGSNFNRTEIKGVNFANNTLAFSNFIYTKIHFYAKEAKGQKTSFQDADLRFCDFNEASIARDIKFNGARTAGCHFNGADHAFHDGIRSVVRKNYRQRNYAAPTKEAEMGDLKYKTFSKTGRDPDATLWKNIQLFRDAYRARLLNETAPLEINAFPKREAVEDDDGEAEKLKKFDYTHLDFSGLHLNGATFIGVEFNNGNLFNLQAEGATFKNCIFTGANLILANLKGTTLKNTPFNNALLYGTNFQNATFTGSGDFASFFGGITLVQHEEEVEPDDMQFSDNSDDEEDEGHVGSSKALPNPALRITTLISQFPILNVPDAQSNLLLTMTRELSMALAEATDLLERAQAYKTRAERAEAKLKKKKADEKDGGKKTDKPEILYIGANFMGVTSNGKDAFTKDKSTDPFKELTFWESGDAPKYTTFCEHIQKNFTFTTGRGTKKKTHARPYLDEFDGITHQRPVQDLFKKVREGVALFEG